MTDWLTYFETKESYQEGKVTQTESYQIQLKLAVICFEDLLFNNRAF